MRAWILAAAAVAALTSLPASADHRHRVFYPHPYVSVGYGYPFGYGFYRPYYHPWYGSSFGVGVHIDRSSSRRVRTSRTEREQGALTLYVYPAAGQSEQQTADDRYECHVWAADRSGYDPTLGTRGRDEAESYTRAFSACMEGRDYVVK